MDICVLLELCVCDELITRPEEWLRYCATNQKDAGSIPDCHWNFPLT
jgi:hypothetical protein